MAGATFMNDSSTTSEPVTLSGPSNALVKNVPILSLVGSALKKGIDTSSSTSTTNPRKRKRSGELSWRERLESKNGRPEIGNSDNSTSESEASVSNDLGSSSGSEYSEWDGFSDDKDLEVAAIYEDAHVRLESRGDVETSEEGASSSTDQHTQQNNDAEQQTSQRLKDFKTWARQQSGLEGTESNIASLPVLRPEQVKAIMASRKLSSPFTKPQIKPLGESSVTILTTLHLTVGILRQCPEIISDQRGSLIAPNYWRGTTDNGGNKRV